MRIADRSSTACLIFVRRPRPTAVQQPGKRIFEARRAFEVRERAVLQGYSNVTPAVP
jgi:hypothetical protein